MRHMLEGLIIGTILSLAVVGGLTMWRGNPLLVPVAHAQNSRGSGFTQSFSLTTTYVAVVAVTPCRNITVGEDRSAGGFPTATFLVAKPGNGSTGRVIISGGTYSFMSQSMFMPGDIVGYVKLSSGSSTFFQDESPV